MMAADPGMPSFVPGRLDMQETDIADVRLGSPTIRPDVRGWFIRIFDEAEWPTSAAHGEGRWVQENQLRSRYSTIRGLHCRAGLDEAKLIRVVSGEIFDVVLDLRPWSPTFLKRTSFILDDHRHEQLFVPPGCAHGFQALSDRVDICIKTSAFYDPERDRGVRWSDPELEIPWPIPNPVLSPRDQASPMLADVKPLLKDWFGEAPPETAA
jgi:dTDP-4-dehydrorhamnose 3,5-epimerase